MGVPGNEHDIAVAGVLGDLQPQVEDPLQQGCNPLLGAWLTSFAIGVSIAAPTAILVAPAAQRLVGHLTGASQH